MNIEQFNIGSLNCRCAVNQDATNMAYILYPMVMPQSWIKELANTYGVSIAVITNMDWDNDLTPWEAPGQPKGSPDFKGLAPEFLKTLANNIIPAIEHRHGLRSGISRTLVGVSLSGLFTLWQWPLCDLFLNIATLSGSYWYEDFEQWILKQPFSNKKGMCYMLLGKDEPHSATPAFRSVGTCTANIAGYMRRQGVDVTYNIVPGNHFQYGRERLEKAFRHLFGHDTKSVCSRSD